MISSLPGLSGLPRSDLPSGEDPTARLLPWMVAVMVFIAAQALCGAFAVSDVVDQWTRDAVGTLTVQIEPPGVDAQAATETDRRVKVVMDILSDHPAVAEARDIPEPELRALMEPWLGAPALVMDLPLPRLIDVTLNPDMAMDVASLSDTLVSAVPGATVDDHRVWLNRLVDLAEGLSLLAFSAVALVTAATALAVIHATRSGLSMYHGTIDVLHIIGAQDDYIAGQFARRGLILGLKGGVMGLILAIPALFLIGLLIDRLEGGFIPEATLGLSEWLILACLPIASGLLAMVTARFTVLRNLARLT
ncbi:MAG: cell division protein FtsX [Rhodospirillaceae bacterium]